MGHLHEFVVASWLRSGVPFDLGGLVLVVGLMGMLAAYPSGGRWPFLSELYVLPAWKPVMLSTAAAFAAGFASSGGAAGLAGLVASAAMVGLVFRDMDTHPRLHVAFAQSTAVAGAVVLACTPVTVFSAAAGVTFAAMSALTARRVGLGGFAKVVEVWTDRSPTPHMNVLRMLESVYFVALAFHVVAAA